MTQDNFFAFKLHPSKIARKLACEYQRYTGRLLYWGMRFGEGMIASIQQAAPAHWTIFPMHFLRNVGDRLESTHIDGVIADLHTTADVEVASRLPVPVIDAAGSMRQQGFPKVCTDEFAVAEAAMTHLSKAGHTRFAFIGYSDHDYSKERLLGFRNALRRAGLPFPAIIETPWDSGIENMEAWLSAIAEIEALPESTGIFCCSDVRLVSLHTFAMGRGNSRIFADHGVIGVDDDRELMRIHAVHFPSISLDFESLGRAAVDVMANSLRSPVEREEIPEAVLIRPFRTVVPEGYQQRVHSIDPVVDRALSLIRAELSTPLPVGWIAQKLDVSQSTLERRFREHLGQTPNQWIQQLRFERAAELLIQTDLSVKEVSNLIGFAEQRRLTQLFHHVVGMTPSEYRNRNGSSG